MNRIWFVLMQYKLFVKPYFLTMDMPFANNPGDCSDCRYEAGS